MEKKSMFGNEEKLRHNFLCKEKMEWNGMSAAVPHTVLCYAMGFTYIRDTGDVKGAAALFSVWPESRFMG
jgi:hypothetical protein